MFGRGQHRDAIWRSVTKTSISCSVGH